ncbi:hypothetical protein J7F03_39625, partial [Streptomyces sp. ISL-43]|uniref:hypothetical protein n=1 Tax=Streptomyces sp. ISL-43 TaxID=2819183 RepID=UPI001BE8C781
PNPERFTVLLVFGAALSAMWLVWLGRTDLVELGLPVVGLSFAATLVSGLSFLSRETQRRRAPQVPPVVWPGWAPPADSK